MSYKYDGFISYARVNDTTNWVSAFAQKLGGKLQEKLTGGTARVFLELDEVGIGPLKPHFVPQCRPVRSYLSYCRIAGWSESGARRSWQRR
jgi:hypothetical protein